MDYAITHMVYLVPTLEIGDRVSFGKSSQLYTFLSRKDKALVFSAHCRTCGAAFEASTSATATRGIVRNCPLHREHKPKKAVIVKVKPPKPERIDYSMLKQNLSDEAKTLLQLFVIEYSPREKAVNGYTQEQYMTLYKQEILKLSACEGINTML